MINKHWTTCCVCCETTDITFDWQCHECYKKYKQVGAPNVIMTTEKTVNLDGSIIIINEKNQEKLLHPKCNKCGINLEFYRKTLGFHHSIVKRYEFHLECKKCHKDKKLLDITVGKMKKLEKIIIILVEE